MSINPGLLTTEGENQVIASLKTQEAIFFIDRIEFMYDGNQERSFGQFSPYLYSYLYNNFQEIRQFGSYTVRVNSELFSKLPQECK